MQQQAYYIAMKTLLNVSISVLDFKKKKKKKHADIGLRHRRRRTLFADKTQLYIQAIAKTEIITAGYQNRPKPNKTGRLITNDNRKKMT
jgi:hypothetical protein